MQEPASYKTEGGIKSLYLNGRDGYAEFPAVDFRKISFSIAIRFKTPDVHILGHLISDWSSPWQFRVFVFGTTVQVVLRRSGEVQFLLRLVSNRLVAFETLCTTGCQLSNLKLQRNKNGKHHPMKQKSPAFFIVLWVKTLLRLWLQICMWKTVVNSTALSCCWTTIRQTNVEHGINTFFVLNIECIDKYEKDTGDSEKNPSSPNRSRTYDLLVTSPDALPLSYRRLVGAKANKLGSCDKHPAYC